MGYQSVWNDKANVVERVLEEIRAEYPQAWQAAHNPQRGDKTQREEYCQRVCLRLRALGIPAGMNGKRGNPQDLSEDIIALPREDSLGAPDTSGRYPSIEIRDVIAGAGPDKLGNQAGKPYFGDVTQQTIDGGAAGCYVEPTAQSGQSRPPIGGGTTKPPVPDLVPSLEKRLAALETQNVELLLAVRNSNAALAVVLGAINDLEKKLLDGGGAFDMQTKRIFGVDGSDNFSVAEEVIHLLQTLPPDQRVGALEGCKVAPFLRRG